MTQFIELTRSGRKFLLNTGYIIGISSNGKSKTCTIEVDRFAEPEYPCDRIECVDESYEQVMSLLSLAECEISCLETLKRFETEVEALKHVEVGECPPSPHRLCSRKGNISCADKKDKLFSWRMLGSCEKCWKTYLEQKSEEEKL